MSYVAAWCFGAMISALLWAVVGAAAGWGIGQFYVEWFHVPVTEWRSYYWIGWAIGIGFVAGGLAGRFVSRPFVAVLALAALAIAAGWITGDRPPSLWLEVEVRGAVGDGGVTQHGHAGLEVEGGALPALGADLPSPIPPGGQGGGQDERAGAEHGRESHERGEGRRRGQREEERGAA